MLLAIFQWRTDRHSTLTRRDFPAMTFVVLCGFTWPFSIQPYLVGRAGSAFIGMMVSFTPLLTVLASIPLLKVLPARRQLFGVLGALVFMGLLIREGVNRQIKPIDLALALTVPLCYALTNTLIRKSLSHVAALELSLVSLTAAGMVLLSTSLMIPFERPEVAGNTVLTSIASVAFLGVVGTGVATFLFNRLIQEQGPLFAGMATNLAPIGALMLGWLDAEHISPLQIAALAACCAWLRSCNSGPSARFATRRFGLSSLTLDFRLPAATSEVVQTIAAIGRCIGVARMQICDRPAKSAG